MLHFSLPLVNVFSRMFILQVLKEIEKHSIDIYQYPECDSDEDEEFKQQDKQLKVLYQSV